MLKNIKIILKLFSLNLKNEKIKKKKNTKIKKNNFFFPINIKYDKNLLNWLFFNKNKIKLHLVVKKSIFMNYIILIINKKKKKIYMYIVCSSKSIFIYNYKINKKTFFDLFYNKNEKIFKFFVYKKKDFFSFFFK